MSSLKIKFLSSVAAMTLCTNLYANEISYTIKSQSLKEAIEVISKKSKVPYIVNGKLLENKTSKAVKDIKGTKNALNQILENSGLEADIEDGAIIIKEKKTENKSKNDLGEVDVLASIRDGSVENGYLVKDITGVGAWGSRSLQDTPYQISVMSSDLVENTGSSSLAQLFKMNPLTQESTNRSISAAPYVALRGFQEGSPVYDGLPIYTSTINSISMVEIDRVEIINGTTGFLYGGGKVGGAVNYVTKSPTQEDLREVTIGNYGGDQYYIHTDLGGHFDEDGKFGYRVNLLYSSGENETEQDIEQKLASFAFDWDISDNVYAELKYSHNEIERDRLNSSFSFSSVDYRTMPDSSESYSPKWSYNNLEHDRVTPSLEWNINDHFTLRTKALYELTKSTPVLSYLFAQPDGTYNHTFYHYDELEYETYGGSAYLDSEFSTGSFDHKLTLGYMTSFYGYSSKADGFESSSVSGISLSEASNTTEPAWASVNEPIRISSERTVDNIIIGDDISFNEQWSALIGYNYASMEYLSFYNTVGGENNGEVKSKYDKSEWTPTFSLIYKPIKDLTTYVTYMEALEQGTIVSTSYSNSGDILPPLVSKQYEIGAKYNLNDNILISSALFRIEKANQYSNGASPQPKYVQDGEEIHEGIELSIIGKATENLTIMTGGTWMDLSIEKANNASLEGENPINVASKMAKIYAEYTIPSIQGLTITGGAYYTGKKYGDTLNKDVLPAYTIYDMGIRYKTKIDEYPTTFNFNISNLTDKNYWASNDTLGSPRNIVFSMKMEF